ncbi:E3 ubiquitin-protein ligase RNF149-like [Punica granatum]|uniref:RING-type domain-containing protein n=2 Tax=Punica granatum TaxID=22663 RepID=A0A218W3K7_PUNGR|nr:E3 ubiquitin-protein ligase RNF149-like [Punica granatum]OWM67427.1 hypothetical protein CDL15_Pgr019887 [Punica granatum]PKI74203.1 hypothetical protein CRG98_005441 [Punica granatum]
MASLWELQSQVIHSSTHCNLLDHWASTTDPSVDTTSTSSSSELELIGGFDFYLTRKHHRFIVQDHSGDEIIVEEFYDFYPRSHHRHRLPVVLLRNPHMLESFLCCDLADLGLDPMPGHDITGAVLSDVYGGHTKKFFASVNLEITKVEVVWVEPDDGSWVQALPYEGLHGASSTAISKLNAASFVAGETAGDIGTCVVCLEDLSRGGPECNRVRLTEMPSKHVFHNSCILRWLETNRTCPLCRQELEDDG